VPASHFRIDVISKLRFAAMTPLIGLAAVVVVLILVLFVVSIYNRLVRNRNGVDRAAATVDVQLKQRCDLIPNLVSSARGYMDHERGVLEQLTALRERASAPGAPIEERVRLDGEMSQLLRGLLVRVEAYPELKASEPVQLLQRSLNEVEAQIAAARRTYNAAVTDYNIAIETVPASLLAGSLGFARRGLFEATATDRAVPTVSLRS
jgi:LemA protein